MDSNSSMSVSDDSGENNGGHDKTISNANKDESCDTSTIVDSVPANGTVIDQSITAKESGVVNAIANGGTSEEQRVNRKRKEAGSSSFETETKSSSVGTATGSETHAGEGTPTAASTGIAEPSLKIAKHNLDIEEEKSTSTSASASTPTPTSLQTPVSSLQQQHQADSSSSPAGLQKIPDNVTPTPPSNSKSKNTREPATTPDSVSQFVLKEDQIAECDPAFRSMVNLDPVPDAPPIKKPSPREVAQLELSLQIGDKFSDHSEDTTWREDWNGNLQLLDKDIVMNRDDLVQNAGAKVMTMQFCDWVAKLARHSDDFIGIKLLFRFVYHMKGTPSMAKRILAYSIECPTGSVSERLQLIMDASRRISYDPTVLTQDGWRTVKADAPDGHTGGSYLIGRRIIWHSFEAIVIAFVRDEDIGDLWKCLWTEDLDTFDLEADELQEGMKKWERKVAKRKAASSAPTTKAPRPSVRFEASRHFSVEGIEDGIILAKSYKSKGGQPWPARVMHVTEVKALGIQQGSRRSSSKNEIHVVFLSPFWNGGAVAGIPTATSQYATGPLFELETIDVSDRTIQKYPFSTDDGSLSITNLRQQFKFLGLPKAAFPRFLDSHRLAVALKNYASKESKKNSQGAIDADATASLTDTHPLSIKTFSFPDALLNVPFEYILSKYPDPVRVRASRSLIEDDTEVKEPIMQLHGILASITPPNCWNENPGMSSACPETPVKKTQPLSLPDSKGLTPTMSPALNASKRIYSESDKKTLWNVDSFASSYLLEYITAAKDGDVSPLHSLYSGLEKLVKNLNRMVIESEETNVQNLEARKEKLASLLVQCLTMKGQREEDLYSIAIPATYDKDKIVREWRKACERIFKRAIVRLGHVDAGNRVTAVLTDSRCNEHITASGSFERAVRLPAAVKGAKNAGAGSSASIPIITKIEDNYLSLVEDRILPMAHKGSYLKRMKKKISALARDAKGVPLTDDSDGEGGEDTSKFPASLLYFTLNLKLIFHFILHSGIKRVVYRCSHCSCCSTERSRHDCWR